MKLKKSITNQISIYIFIAIFFMGTVFFLGYYFYSSKRENISFTNEIDTRTETLAQSIADNLWNLDDSTVERILNVFYSSTNVIEIKLISENMNISLSDKIGNKEYFYTINKKIYYEEDIKDNKASKESIGTINIIFSNETEMIKRKTFFMFIFIILLVTIITISILLKIALNTSLQKAFEDFGYGLRKIADGDYDYISKIKKERKLKTEFTPLLSDLSKMAIEIEAQMTKREKVELELIEIGEHLEEKVKERTEELNKAKNDLLSLSREAGMADIATDVIHNIGNALNSITTNTDFIYSYIKDLKVPVIDKIAGLFEKNKENFGDFISKDATGKKIPIVIRQFSGYLQSIKDNSLKDIKNIKRDITHIQNVIDNQQTYAKNILVMELYSPAEIMNEAIRMNKNILGKHNVSIELKYSDVSIIKTDKHKILQVLLNLFSNSKFAFENTPRDNRNIICFVRKENNFLEYEIKDNGIGIEGKNLKKIFNYGFTTREDGHGFGLHNSANTIKQLKGELVATSDGIGKGASFIVKIPY